MKTAIKWLAIIAAIVAAPYCFFKANPEAFKVIFFDPAKVAAVKEPAKPAYEERFMKCERTETGQHCKFKSGALDKSGRWITGEFWINRNSAEAKVDGIYFYGNRVEYSESRGQRLAEVELRASGAERYTAYLYVKSDYLSFEVTKPDGQKLVQATN